jgi:hypothetical protein
MMGFYMDEKQIDKIVAEVLNRLAKKLAGEGESGLVIAVFGGATLGYDEALHQIRSLVLRGFRVQLLFSQGAECLYAKFAWQHWEGLPNVTFFDPSHWLKTVKEARALVVPMLSLNTLSKLALLLADNLASNLILHALFAGKPVVLARNGVDPADEGRIVPHFDKCGPVLARAIEERMQTVRGYGCHITDVAQLTQTLEAALERKPAPAASGHGNGAARITGGEFEGHIITAADVLRAYHLGMELRLRSSAVVTPLARELAVKHGVCLVQGRSC